MITPCGIWQRRRGPECEDGGLCGPCDLSKDELKNRSWVVRGKTTSVMRWKRERELEGLAFWLPWQTIGSAVGVSVHVNGRRVTPSHSLESPMRKVFGAALQHQVQTKCQQILTFREMAVSRTLDCSAGSRSCDVQENLVYGFRAIWLVLNDVVGSWGL
jgi:hypothetical protein